MLRVKPGEGAPAVLAGGFFFLVLFGYFLIRPVREAMGVQRDTGDLRWLFVVTCGVSLVVTLLFGGVVSRTDRSRFIPLALRVVSGCLIGFVGVLWRYHGESVVAGYVFYVWVSVINLFITSVFWAFMADIWSLEQGKRLFPAIGIGGTLGAFLGSLVAWRWSEQIGPAGLMLVSALVFEGAVWVMRAADAHAPRAHRGSGERAHGAPIGGKWMDGLWAMLRSPYLMGIGLYLMLMGVCSTLIYFLQAGIVSGARAELEGRVALFAQLDMWTQVATLLVQLFVTGRMIRRIGVGWTLAVLPLVTVLGFAAMAWISSRRGVEGWQVFAVFALFNAAHRATRYAVARPARETLFSVVPPAEKYKAKPIVDVFLYRGGDVAGTQVDRLLAIYAVGMGGIALAVVPLAAFWGGLGLWLAWRQGQMDQERVNRSGSGSGRQEMEHERGGVEQAGLNNNAPVSVG